MAHWLRIHLLVQEMQVWSLGSRRSPGGGNSNPLWYSCQENPMNRGAWWDTVHGVTKSRTQTERLTLSLYLVLHVVDQDSFLNIPSSWLLHISIWGFPLTPSGQSSVFSSVLSLSLSTPLVCASPYWHSLWFCTDLYFLLIFFWFVVC